MSRVGSASINLDDIFNAVGVTATSTAAVHAPVQPKSRTTTATSDASSVSTVKGNPVTTHSVVEHYHASSISPRYDEPPAEPAFTAPPVRYEAPPAVHYEQPPHGSDDLLDSVFSAVQLPSVDLRGRQSHEVDHAIRDLDDALEGEDSAIEHDSVVSEPRYRAPSSHVTSHVSSHPSAVGSNANSHHHSAVHEYASAHHPQYTSSVVSNGASKISSHHASEPQPDYDTNEQYDNFESNHQYPSRPSSYFRPRSATIDSTISAAETRYGQFDVHDDLGHPTNVEINLHHNEVAYDRPAHVSAPSSVASQPSHVSSVHTGGTYKLRQINREVEEARHRQSQLTHQVEKERAEVDRLRRQNLAKEAAVKVNRIGAGVQPQQPQYAYTPVDRHSPQSYHGPGTVSDRSPKSIDSSSIYEEEPTHISPIAARQKAAGEHISTHGKYELIVPQYAVVPNFSQNNRINKVIIGGESHATDDDKTILLFGPVGSGKTSVINSCLNYLYDVKKENEFRFVLDEHVHHTTGLTAYVFNNTVLSYNVTIVDTPGVVDRKDDRTVSTLVKQWFEQELLSAGAFRLDAISIVLRHDDNMLGWPFIYELAAVKKMFGDDLKTNVLPIITNAEVLPQPIAIKSLAQANISFLEYYKVNNQGFAADFKGISKLQHNLFFTHGVASLESLFRDLQELIHPLVAVLRHAQGRKVEPPSVIQKATLY